MIIDCAHYLDGRRRDEGPVADRRGGPVHGGRLCLARVVRARGKELAEIRDTFGLHDLAVEDAKKFHLRPKVEQYDDGVQLVILRTAGTTTTARRSTSVRSASSCPPAS